MLHQFSRKKDLLDKTNYRQVSVLPSNLCGYRKGFCSQYALLFLIERWKKILDDKGFGGTVLMDLSQALDTLIMNY